MEKIKAERPECIYRISEIESIEKNMRLLIVLLDMVTIL